MRALITGITGQDGSYLADLLLEKGYEVHGLIRRASTFNTKRIEHIYQDPHAERQRLFLHYGDLTDALNLTRLVEKVAPDEVYNLAAQSHVKVSFESPVYTADVDALGTIRLLEALRQSEVDARFVQASSSEMFGESDDELQDESTPFRPRSPYAAAKLHAHWTTVNYRDAWDMHASTAIMFNHESPRRGKTFVTRKITRAVARIKHGLDDTLYLGNLDARRDWGHAPEYVDAMWRMAQLDEPGDYVLATGESHSVREFATLAFEHAGFSVEWRGDGIDEVAVDTDTGDTLVEIDPDYFRPTEVTHLRGDASRARGQLDWEPETPFQQLVEMMVDHDLDMVDRLVTLREAGHDVIEQGVD